MLLLAQKTSQVALHMSVAFSVTYLCTGSLATGGIAAVLEPICNVALLPLHDRVWRRLRERQPSPSTPERRAQPRRRPEPA